ncbi:uncharacterized protein B0H64DRAFT_383353 [Chaetomium fimeti]|uniref:Uncharacterized protein n=1 Tax=Chaetomium fimeti TaxID=1854472 RepID=A0AAE0HRH5_9PEZI|nr:hypothetical protein B0H64DRAFT_383353 [Chaetomium fimeti]
MIPGVPKPGGTPGNWKGWGLVVFLFSFLESGGCFCSVCRFSFYLVVFFSHFYSCLDVGCAHVCNVGWIHPSLCLIPALVAATTTTTPGGGGRGGAAHGLPRGIDFCFGPHLAPLLGWVAALWRDSGGGHSCEGPVEAWGR